VAEENRGRSAGESKRKRSGNREAQKENLGTRIITSLEALSYQDKLDQINNQFSGKIVRGRNSTLRFIISKTLNPSKSRSLT
jgi:hypothetical protein